MDTCNHLFRGLADGYDYDAIRFLGAFTKLRKKKKAISFVIRLSAWNNSPPTERIFMKFCTWVFLEILPKKPQVPLKSDKKRELYIKT